MTREEAIERVKTRFCKCALDSEDMKAVQILIPELCESESEDERIRKFLVEKFSKLGEIWPEYSTKTILAYLEKQKDILSERERNITSNMLEDGIEGIQRELIEFLSNNINASWVDTIKSADAYAQRIRSMLEKQKEPYYSPLCNTIKDKIREYIANHFIADSVVKTDMRSIVKAMEEGVRLGKEEQKENKPSISCGHENDIEWSEEDDKIRRNLMSLLANMRGDRITKETYQKYYPWLKSLRPKPHWKPSEEQMEALDNARFCKFYDRSELDSLYEQLKKLM